MILHTKESCKRVNQYNSAVNFIARLRQSCGDRVDGGTARRFGTSSCLSTLRAADCSQNQLAYQYFVLLLMVTVMPLQVEHCSGFHLPLQVEH